MKKTIVEIKDFSVQLGKFKLKKINLEIYKKEIFAVLGKTGSGKTVLLESIAGFYKSDEGNVKIQGKYINDIPIEKREVGFVYQDSGLFPHLNAFENISYGLKMKKIDDIEIKKTIYKIADILSITHILKQYQGTLSGGERQRVALARALVLKPQILLMDEPFSALDPVTKAKMYEQIEEIHNIFDCTIIFVTHDFNEAQRLANRIGIMSNGELKGICNSRELFIKSNDEEQNNFLGIN